MSILILYDCFCYLLINNDRYIEKSLVFGRNFYMEIILVYTQVEKLYMYVIRINK